MTFLLGNALPVPCQPGGGDSQLLGGIGASWRWSITIEQQLSLWQQLAPGILGGISVHLYQPLFTSTVVYSPLPFTKHDIYMLDPGMLVLLVVWTLKHQSLDCYIAT